MSTTSIYIKKFKKLYNAQRIKDNACDVGEYAIQLSNNEIAILRKSFSKLDKNSSDFYLTEFSNEMLITAGMYDFRLEDIPDNILTKFYKEFKIRLDNL